MRGVHFDMKASVSVLITRLELASVTQLLCTYKVTQCTNMVIIGIPRSLTLNHKPWESPELLWGMGGLMVQWSDRQNAGGCLQFGV